MSNARKLANIVVGTEVVILSVDSDLANKINSIKSRLDSDDAKLQSLDTVIKTGLTNLVDSDLIINQLQAKITNIVANNDSDSAALQAIKTQIGLIQGRQDSDSNQIQSLSTSLLGEISSTNTNITSIVSRLDSDELKLQSLDTTLVQIKSRLDSDEIKIQSVTSLAVAASSSGAISDSDLKVVADLRNQLDSEIIAVRNLSLTYINYTYTATAGQTSFTGSDANSLTLAYTAGSIQVFLNGFKLETDDYTATDGTSVVLARGASASHQLTILVPTLKSNPAPLTSVDWSGLSLTSSLQYSGTKVASGLFGEVVAIDGNYAAITARNYYTGSGVRGRGYIFFKSSGTWAQQAELVNTEVNVNGGGTGGDIAIDGDTVVFPDGGAPGYIRVYTRSGTTWSLQQKITGTGTAMAGFGKSSIALSGDRLAIGCHSYATPGSNAGRIAVYSRTGSTWSFEAFLDPSDVAAGDQIGYHSLHMSGNYIIAGEIVGAGSAYIWFYNGSSWVQQQKLTASDGSSGDYFGINCVIDGDIAVVSAPWVASEKGSVYVYTRSGTTWTESAKLGASGSIPSDLVAGHQFGYTLSLDGSSLICGAPHMAGGGANGAADAYIFTTTDGGSTWTQGKKLTSLRAFNDAYAYDRRSVAIDETAETAIVGAGKDDTGGTQVGIAHFYDT